MADRRVLVKVLGGGGEVGRLSVLLRYSDSRRAVILDAGVNFDENDNPVFANTYPPKYVEAIVLSHAHLDHIGTAPMYYISGNPAIYATRPTLEMARLMWADFLKINGYYSPYEAGEVDKAVAATRTIDYGDEVEAAGFTLRFYNSGHIPGSVFTLIEADGLRIGFTGDVNTVETKLMKGMDIDSIGGVDVLIMEATYGASTHPPRRVSEAKLVSIVEEVVEQGGTVLIPAFSIARGQEVMMILEEYGVDVPVAVDGMIRKTTEIMLENRRYINNPHLLERAYNDYLFVRGWRDRSRVWRRPGVIIASAGMLKGGPSLYYVKKIGGKKKNAVILVSYQAEGSPGRRLLEEGKIPGSEEMLKARLEWLDLSSHADMYGLAEMARRLKPSRIIVVHSDAEVAAKFVEYLRGRVDGDTRIDIAVNNAEYILEA
ncbi:MAG: MBL fold metallo-hydrolase [Crenarchaeota archaeon]|nr:MBL fold metallo-hydrolase [Thermoproteota archaeon]